MGIIWTIIIGFIVGVIAKFIMPGDNEPSGFILTTILGIVGAFVASYLGQALGWYSAGRRRRHHRRRRGRHHRAVRLRAGGRTTPRGIERFRAKACPVTRPGGSGSRKENASKQNTAPGHRPVARRISAQIPVMRAIGCSTNRRHDASADCSVSGGAGGFSCRASTAPWACPSARVDRVSALSRPCSLQRRQHGAHQRQICRPVREMPVHARNQLRLGILAERVQFPDQGRDLGIQGIHRRQLRNPGARGLRRGAGRRDGIGRPRFVMRQQRRQHDQRERVGILIAVEHVANQRLLGLIDAGGEQGVGGKGRPIRQRDRALTASACSGASPR